MRLARERAVRRYSRTQPQPQPIAAAAVKPPATHACRAVAPAAVTAAPLPGHLSPASLALAYCLPAPTCHPHILAAAAAGAAAAATPCLPASPRLPAATNPEAASAPGTAVGWLCLAGIACMGGLVAGGGQRMHMLPRLTN